MGEWLSFRSKKDEMKRKENCSWISRALRFLQASQCDTVSYRGWEVGSWHTRACPINYPGKALSPPASSTSSGVVSLFKCSTRGRVVGTLSKVLRKLNKVAQRRAWWEPWTKREVRPEKTSLALRLSEESPRLQLRLEKEAKNLDDFVQLCWPNLSMSSGLATGVLFEKTILVLRMNVVWIWSWSRLRSRWIDAKSNSDNYSDFCPFHLSSRQLDTCPPFLSLHSLLNH